MKGDIMEFVDTAVGVGKVEKYYPILIQFEEDGICTKYYLDDIWAWAEGDTSDIAGKEHLIISTLAQITLGHLDVIEAQQDGWPPPEARRVENRNDDDVASDLH